MIYAQRPDATAILELDQWNGRFGRWIKSGASSIILPENIEHDVGNMRIRHYFDISDTMETKNSRPVPVWTMERRFESEIINSLNDTFGPLSDTSALGMPFKTASHT